MTDRPVFRTCLETAGPAAGWPVLLVTLSLIASAAELQQLVGLLSAAERERANRRLPEVRRRAIASRGRLRQLLGRLLKVPAAQVELTTGPQGKPTLAGSLRGLLEFNVSHSGDEGLIAVTRSGPVGIDLEITKPTQTADWAGLMAGTILAEAELARWQQLPAVEAAAAVLDAWVAKEAIFKASGSGIGDRLRQCCLPAVLPRAVLPPTGGLNVVGKSPPWPLPTLAGEHRPTWAAPESVQGFRGCQAPPPAAGNYFHSLPTVCHLAVPELPSAAGSGNQPLAVTLLDLGPGRHAALACPAESVAVTVGAFPELVPESA